MQDLLLVSTLAVIWLHFAAGTTLLQTYIPNPNIARSSGMLILVSSLFFVEHFYGMGKLHYIYPVSSVLALSLVYSRRKSLAWRAEAVFVASMSYPLLWIYSFPNIDTASERLTNLYFISNYLPGKTLPPIDNWHPPYQFDFYYALQHYGAALMGRLFKLDIGYAFNLASVVLMGLTISLAWEISSRFVRSRISRLFLVATLAFGGTGLSPLLHLVFDGPESPTVSNDNTLADYQYQQHVFAHTSIIRSARFFGGDDQTALYEDTGVHQGFADIFFPPTASLDSAVPARVLPLENFGYQFFMGDYHPPVGGFFLLLLALAIIVSIEVKPTTRVYEAILAFTVPMSLVTNAWIFPLQGILVVGWIIHRHIIRQGISWMWVVGGGLLGFMLVYPFLTGFVSSAANNPLSLVDTQDHTPLSRFLAMFWPIVLLLLLSFFNKQWRNFSIAFGLTFAFMIFLSEMIFVDDPTAGIHIRTNTVMKWWGYSFTGMTLIFASICLGSKQVIVKICTIFVLVLMNFTAFDVLKLFYYAQAPDAGKLEGHHWITKSSANRDVFNYLKEAPEGIVLEHLPIDAFMQSTAYALFNGKSSYMGWPSHLRTWHSDTANRDALITQKVRAFFEGIPGDHLEWIDQGNIRYIVFDQVNDPQLFSAINERIQSKFIWRGFNHDGQNPVGLWERY